MNSCSYLLKSNNRVLSAKEYGYWSLRWSHDNAEQAIKDLGSIAFKDLPIVSQAQKDPFWLQFHLIALYTASYWMFASTFPHLKKTISTETYTATLASMKVGLTDGIRDLRQYDGQPYSKELSSLFMDAFGTFHTTVRDDLVGATGADSNVVNVNLSRTSSEFINGLARFYKINLTEIDILSELTLANFIDDIAPNHILAISELIVFRS